jgi:hypothetical protein
MNNTAAIIATNGVQSSVASAGTSGACGGSALAALTAGLAAVAPILVYVIYLYGKDNDWWCKMPAYGASEPTRRD